VNEVTRGHTGHVLPSLCSTVAHTVVMMQARVEVGVLQFLNTRGDPDNKHHIVRMRDFFMHRSHLCLVFELLSVNLYELVKHNQFRGLSINLLRFFILQVIVSTPESDAPLLFLEEAHPCNAAVISL